MRYKILGKSGLRVSELCLGTMSFGSQEPWATPEVEVRKVFDAFVSAGGNFIDTANMYAGGESEKLVGRLVAADRERYVIASKFSNAVPGSGNPNAGGSHRKSLTQSLDATLKRLSVDYLDLYLVHFWDFSVPVEELMRAMDDAVRAGKILHAGLSDVPAWVVARAQAYAELRGGTPVSAMQLEYSLVERSIEREHLPMAADQNIGIMAWSPIAGGILSGKYTRPQIVSNSKRRLDSMQLQALSERNRAIALKVDTVADRLAISSSQVALAWLIQRGVIPIIGATSMEQMQQNLQAVDVKLDAETMLDLEQTAHIDLGHPYQMYYWDMSMQLGYGGMFDDIDIPDFPLPRLGRWSGKL